MSIDPNAIAERIAGKQPPRRKAETNVSAILAERLRIAAILEAPEANGRQKLALELALRTNSDAATAKALLAVSPRETEGAFLEAMFRESPRIAPVDSGDVGDARAQRIREIQQIKKAGREKMESR